MLKKTYSDLSEYEKTEIAIQYAEEFDLVLVSKETLNTISIERNRLFKYDWASFTQRLRYLFTGKLD